MHEIKKIYITGCAKTGTTLLFWLFRAFEANHVSKPEVFIQTFVQLAELSESNVFVGKRRGKTILSCDGIKPNNIEKQLRIIKENDIKIINVIRDGRDVVLSNNNYVSTQRWISCMKQRRQFGKYIKCEIKYEDLIANPDTMQLRIAHKFGLTIKHKFSEYPNFVSDSIFTSIREKILRKQCKSSDYKEQVESYTKRPLTDSSIGKDKKAYIKLCKDKQEILEFEKELRLAGYLEV